MTPSRENTILCSSVNNAQGESRALEGRRVSSKSPSRVRDREEGVAGRNGREKHFRQGVIDLTSRQINDFLQKGKQKKIELVFRPGLCTVKYAATAAYLNIWNGFS